MWHRLASSADPGERELVALWTNLEEILVYLSRDPSDDVRAAVALNPDASREVLKVLCGDHCDRVADTADDSLHYVLVGAITGESSVDHRTGNRDGYAQLTGKKMAA